LQTLNLIVLYGLAFVKEKEWIIFDRVLAQDKRPDHADHAKRNSEQTYFLFRHSVLDYFYLGDPLGRNSNLLFKQFYFYRTSIRKSTFFGFLIG
jgi:hypothetical protein